MKRFLLVLLYHVFIIIFVPYIIVSLSRTNSNNSEQKDAADEPIKTITSYVSSSGEVQQIDFSEYLKGVVAAEMPASFHEEALKAQAVAARSYILTRMQGYMRDGAPKEHDGAMTCDNPAHCKAWSSKETLKKQWGENFDMYWDKISSSVEDTGGVVMTYEGTLVNAVFHSTSSGYTENAKDVWGSDVAYLVSVKSEGDELSPKYNDSLMMSIDEYKNIILKKYPDANWDNKELLESINRSNAGGITTIESGGCVISGPEFRSLFSLRSTNIDFSYDDKTITMTTKGNGHGVGMSQYGANYLASTGKNYKDILKAYYTGVNVGVFEGRL